MHDSELHREYITPPMEREPSSQSSELLPPDEMALFLAEVSAVVVEEPNSASEGILQIALREICDLANRDPETARSYVSALLETRSLDLQVRSVEPILWLAAKSPSLGQAAWHEVRDRFPDAVVDSCVIVEDALSDRSGSGLSLLPPGPAGLVAAKFYWDEMRPLI